MINTDKDPAKHALRLESEPRLAATALGFLRKRCYVIEVVHDP